MTDWTDVINTLIVFHVAQLFGYYLGMKPFSIIGSFFLSMVLVYLFFTVFYKNKRDLSDVEIKVGSGEEWK